MKRLIIGLSLILVLALFISSCTKADPEEEYQIVKDRILELKLKKPESQEESEAIIKEAKEILSTNHITWEKMI